MSLAVIGAGFGRTGTMSLKLALEQLGLGPCYHMIDVIQAPERVQHWARAAEGEQMDWDAVFDGYRSAVDWPVCDYWRELAAYYPDAKIILTVRDPDSWYASTQNTIFGPANASLSERDPGFARIIRAIAGRHFGGSLSDRDRLLQGFATHNERVRRSIPPERLLVFQVREGWTPLCRFLGLVVPEAPFPTANSTDEFRQKVAQRGVQ